MKFSFYLKMHGNLTLAEVVEGMQDVERLVRHYDTCVAARCGLMDSYEIRDESGAVVWLTAFVCDDGGEHVPVLLFPRPTEV